MLKIFGGKYTRGIEEKERDAKPKCAVTEAAQTAVGELMFGPVMSAKEVRTKTSKAVSFMSEKKRESRFTNEKGAYAAAIGQLFDEAHRAHVIEQGHKLASTYREIALSFLSQRKHSSL